MVLIVAESVEKFKALCAAYKIPKSKATFSSVKDYLAAQGRVDVQSLDYIDDDSIGLFSSRT